MFRKLTSLSLALLSLQFATAADCAGEYLHRGAQKYIFGEKEKAKAEVTTGLEKYPGDEPLQQMLALFREEEKKDQKPQDQEQQKEQKDEQKKEQQKPQEQKDQDKRDQQKQDGQKPDQPKDGQQEKQDQNDGKDGKSEPKDPQQGETKDGKDGGKPEPMPGQEDKKLSGDVKAANPSQQQQQQQDKEEKEAAEALAEQEAAAEGKMTERQAKALLESLKSEDEKVRLLDPNERKKSGRVLRDW